MRSRRLSVALLVESSNAYARSLLRGISQYVREHDSWSVFLPELERGHEPPEQFRLWRGDGVIARIENARIAAAVRAAESPVVDLSAARELPDVPWVETDDAAIARLAFEHLRRRGLTQFAFCSAPRFQWSRWRRTHFTELTRGAGFPCFEFPPLDIDEGEIGDESWLDEQHALIRWLLDLPKPIGIMAAYDIQGQRILDACRACEIAVPEQVAVIGVDNDDVICELCNPPLASVVPDGERAGYIAAGLLDELMAGRFVNPQAILIPPLGIESRQSANIFATIDKSVAAAMEFIRLHACDGIGVDDVARAMDVSRRGLDRRFVATMGRTAHAELERVRIERVKQLLADTTLPLATVAERSGFAYAESLSVAFKRAVGISPGEFRKQQGAPLKSRMDEEHGVASASVAPLPLQQPDA